MMSPGIPRLSIPAYNWWNEGLQRRGAFRNATVFPQAIGLAATWDTDLIHRRRRCDLHRSSRQINDAIQHGNPALLRPHLLVSQYQYFRDPAGDAPGTYGEDPYLH